MSELQFRPGPIVVGIGLCLAAYALPVPQEVTEGVIQRRIEKIAAEAVEEGGVPGLSVAVALGEELLVASGFGHVGEGGRRAADADTVYRAGSLGDQFLAAAILALVEADELTLDDEISEHLPDFAWEGETMTLHHLLSETSGLTDFTQLVSPEAPTAEILERVKGEGLEFTPGTCFAYSATNQLLLGAILEKVTEKSVAEHLSATLFEALDMESTAYRDDGPPIAVEAGVREEVGDEIEHENAGHRLFEGEKLCSTARDLVRWQRALVEGDVFGTSMYERMASAVTLSDGTSSPCGYFQNITKLDENSGVSHGGSISGYSSHIAYYPAFDLSIALLANTADADLDVLERRIARVVMDVPEPGVQDLELSEDERAAYLGVYKIGCDRLDVRETDEHLLLEMTDRPPLELLYQGQQLFIADVDPGIRVTFLLEESSAYALILDDHGIQMLATRFE